MRHLSQSASMNDGDDFFSFTPSDAEGQHEWGPGAFPSFGSDLRFPESPVVTDLFEDQNAFEPLDPLELMDTVPEPAPHQLLRKIPSSPGGDLLRFPANLFLGPGRFAKLAAGHARQNSMPVLAAVMPQSDTDEEFRALYNDDQIRFNPAKLGFIPGKFWHQDKECTFGQLVNDFFQKKNNANSRFSHKLYNALKISTSDPFYAEFVGVEWLTERVLRIDKRVFARLLGIKTIDGSLFHQQGNFPSHGFVELGEKEALQYLSPEDLKGVDYEGVRLLIHQPGIFTRDCTEEDIERCKWISSRKRGSSQV